MRALSLFVLFAVGCGDDGGMPDDAGGHSDSGRDAASDALLPDDAGGGGDGGGGDAGGGCGASTAMPGDERIELEFEGMMRTYELHVPPGYDGTTPVPLVLNFHGYFGNGAQQRNDTGMAAKSDEEGFIAVHPNGIGVIPSWNGGDCCGAAASMGLDDVGLARAIVDDMASRACIDRRRVYATGFSNGGFLSHRIACEGADFVAAIAPVSGVMGIPDEECTPARPIPVMHFHGTSDGTIPYEGGGIVGNRSVRETIDGWIARNGCTGMAEETYDMGDSHCETVRGCDADVEVTLCTIEGGEHAWPGGTGAGGGPADIDATDAMWELFRRTTLP